MNKNKALILNKMKGYKEKGQGLQWQTALKNTPKTKALDKMDQGSYL
jgi:hypothetical protein